MRSNVHIESPGPSSFWKVLTLIFARLVPWVVLVGRAFSKNRTGIWPDRGNPLAERSLYLRHKFLIPSRSSTTIKFRRPHQCPTAVTAVSVPVGLMTAFKCASYLESAIYMLHDVCHKKMTIKKRVSHRRNTTVLPHLMDRALGCHRDVNEHLLSSHDRDSSPGRLQADSWPCGAPLQRARSGTRCAPLSTRYDIDTWMCMSA